MPRPMVSHAERWRQACSDLSHRGLNLLAVLGRADLRAVAPHATAGFAPGARVLLIGNGGTSLWLALQRTEPMGDDPVDRYTTKVVNRVLQNSFPGVQYLWLYPGDLDVPLQRLGALAGWHQDSPMGIGLHPVYGPWFAYRAALLIDLELPLTPPPPSTATPCDSCRDRPCESACPAHAVAWGRTFAIERCVAHRLSPASDCTYRCAARQACPQGVEHCYDAAQIRYHYGRSLASLTSGHQGSHAERK